MLMSSFSSVGCLSLQTRLGLSTIASLTTCVGWNSSLLLFMSILSRREVIRISRDSKRRLRNSESLEFGKFELPARVLPNALLRKWTGAFQLQVKTARIWENVLRDSLMTLHWWFVLISHLVPEVSFISHKPSAHLPCQSSVSLNHPTHLHILQTISIPQKPNGGAVQMFRSRASK